MGYERTDSAKNVDEASTISVVNSIRIPNSPKGLNTLH